jgi:hypothetical protein
MSMPKFWKILSAGSAGAALVVLGMSIGAPSGQAANDNNGSQDEKQAIQIGLQIAPVTLNMNGKDPDLVGLGSYLVNVGDCNGCHTADPATEFTSTGNPYTLPPPNGPFNGVKKVNPATYLGGGRDFGVFPSPNGTVHIISRNLTPDKLGLAQGQAEGHNTLTQFIQIMRTGIDLDNAHPNCTLSTNPPITTNCLLGIPPFNPPGVPAFNGALLQVMPWPAFQNLTDRQLTAIYTYLSSVPCVEGGPGEPSPRCH